MKRFGRYRSVHSEVSIGAALLAFGLLPSSMAPLVLDVEPLSAQ